MDGSLRVYLFVRGKHLFKGTNLYNNKWPIQCPLQWPIRRQSPIQGIEGNYLFEHNDLFKDTSKNNFQSIVYKFTHVNDLSKSKWVSKDKNLFWILAYTKTIAYTKAITYSN